MTKDFWYVFECDYGSRTKEKPFIKAILNAFNKDNATHVGIAINNNPYCLEFYVTVNIQGDPIDFETWLKSNFPEKSRRVNIFLRNFFTGNVITFVDDAMVDLMITEDSMDKVFILPERELFETAKPQYRPMFKNSSRVFISHSSKDKEKIVNPLNAYLQANNIGTWLDSYEIDYGENIYLKVNEGIDQSELGLFVLTDNFFDSSSGWPLTEFSAFFMALMKSNKKVLLVNAGVDDSKIHTLMKVYKYIMWDNGNGLPEIANAIHRHLKS